MFITVIDNSDQPGSIAHTRRKLIGDETLLTGRAICASVSRRPFYEKA